MKRHLQPTQPGAGSDCKRMAPTDHRSWLLELTRTDFMADLQCWETMQLHEYLQTIDDAVRKSFNIDIVDRCRLSEHPADVVRPWLLSGCVAQQFRSCMPKIGLEDRIGIDALVRNFETLDLTQQKKDMISAQAVRWDPLLPSSCIVSLSPLVQHLTQGRLKAFETLLWRNAISTRVKRACGMHCAGLQARAKRPPFKRFLVLAWT